MIIIQLPDGEQFEVRKTQYSLTFSPIYEHYYTHFIGNGIKNFLYYVNDARINNPYYKLSHDTISKAPKVAAK